MRFRHTLRSLPLAAVASLALVAASPAAADSSQSSNWAGYAVHHPRVNFKQVVGSWTQPRAVCKYGQPTYSSVWVGIGGYSVSSQALEQIGTEVDCTTAGRQLSSAWFELVPAASQPVRIPLRAGDHVRATVAVAGREVTLTLTNLTRHLTFIRRLRAAPVDSSSAEWIVEAPSVCASNGCQTLPLANFGSTGFGAASATTTSGHVGTIDDHQWTTTKITLAEGGRQFIGGGPAGAFAIATPSPLSARDTAFTVTYRGSSGGFTSTMARRVAATRLVHGGSVLTGR